MEISPVVIAIQVVENGDLMIPVNNAFVCHMSLLAIDTQPCVLIIVIIASSIHCKNYTPLHSSTLSTCCIKTTLHSIRYVTAIKSGYFLSSGLCYRLLQITKIAFAFKSL